MSLTVRAAWEQRVDATPGAPSWILGERHRTCAAEIRKSVRLGSRLLATPAHPPA